MAPITPRRRLLIRNGAANSQSHRCIEQLIRTFRETCCDNVWTTPLHRVLTSSCSAISAILFTDTAGRHAQPNPAHEIPQPAASWQASQLYVAIHLLESRTNRLETSKKVHVVSYSGYIITHQFRRSIWRSTKANPLSSLVIIATQRGPIAQLNKSSGLRSSRRGCRAWVCGAKSVWRQRGVCGSPIGRLVSEVSSQICNAT